MSAPDRPSGGVLKAVSVKRDAVGAGYPTELVHMTVRPGNCWAGLDIYRMMMPQIDGGGHMDMVGVPRPSAHGGAGGSVVMVQVAVII